MLLFKGSFGHVEISFDNPAKKISGTTTGFSCQRPRKTKNQYFKTFFDVFTSVQLISVSTRLNIFFTKIRENFPKNPKRDDDSINYFYHFFLKVLLRTREMHF